MNVPPSVDRAAEGVCACELRLRPQITITTFDDVSASRLDGGQAVPGVIGLSATTASRTCQVWTVLFRPPGAAADAATTVLGLLKLLVWLTRTFQVPVRSRGPPVAPADTTNADDDAPGAMSSAVPSAL